MQNSKHAYSISLIIHCLRLGLPSPESLSCSSLSIEKPAVAIYHSCRYFFRCRGIIPYSRLFSIHGTWVQAMNANICCHGWTYLATLSASIYTSNRQYGVWPFSDRTASIRIACPVCYMVHWLLRTMPSMAAHIRRTPCSTGLSVSGNRMATMARNILKSLGVVNSCKYWVHPVTYNHKLASRISPVPVKLV
ncbi:uncharacterized protein BDW43DRAFT_295748 [Aspergillus alliaceus]|uniref:uncharacterized protein n=1 Tax=Petromyces alliaceus TaxID=209559 RepID=UPI0012A61E5F|nr:uncharacterized protein BDW43DRAFT_295748 [Aspergillus alliaceus]KAB8226803.1 hypothetical protein BDW43DRAFT_295748 [Aspergillus alliaceus]